MIRAPPIPTSDRSNVLKKLPFSFNPCMSARSDSVTGWSVMLHRNTTAGESYVTTCGRRTHATTLWSSWFSIAFRPVRTVALLCCSAPICPYHSANDRASAVSPSPVWPCRIIVPPRLLSSSVATTLPNSGPPPAPSAVASIGTTPPARYIASFFSKAARIAPTFKGATAIEASSTSCGPVVPLEPAPRRREPPLPELATGKATSFSAASPIITRSPT